MTDDEQAGGGRVPAVRVSGHGFVAAPPDTAVISLLISFAAPIATEARDQVAVSTSAVLAALRAGGVAADDIRTTAFTQRPAVEWQQRNQERVPVQTGFECAHALETTVRSVDEVGPLLDVVTAAGGNQVTLQRVDYHVRDRAALLQRARLLAMQDARARATDLAAALGQAIGKAIRIDEDGPGCRQLGPQVMGYAAAPSGGPPLEMATGMQQIEVDVTVVFTLS